MTCHFIRTPTVTIVVCTDIEESWHAHLAWECERAADEREHDLDLVDAEDHQHIEVDFCRQRVDTDPFYVENWFEEAERDRALVYADG